MMQQSIAQSSLAEPIRRVDLDWVRIAAFALLILYHVGMFYVPWGWHIKSTQPVTALEPLMLLQAGHDRPIVGQCHRGMVDGHPGDRLRPAAGQGRSGTPGVPAQYDPGCGRGGVGG